MDSSNATFYLAFALFVVWMQRHHRWQALGAAMTGGLTLKNG